MDVLEQLQRGRQRIERGWAQRALALGLAGGGYRVCALGGLLSDAAIELHAVNPGPANEELESCDEPIYELANAARQIWPNALAFGMSPSTMVIEVNDNAPNVMNVLAMYDRAIRNVQNRVVTASEAELATSGD